MACTPHTCCRDAHRLGREPRLVEVCARGVHTTFLSGGGSRGHDDNVLCSQRTCVTSTSASTIAFRSGAYTKVRTSVNAASHLA